MDGSANITTGGDNSCRSCCTPVAQFAEGHIDVCPECLEDAGQGPHSDEGKGPMLFLKQCGLLPEYLL